ncbi:MAG TPA: C1 family peptidase [Vicinamibacterales bacterium]|nr:C1 family peptidase [Vicinamibacterales bacterium]
MPRHIKKFGWVPDLPDARDHVYSAPIPVLGVMPAKVDLGPDCPPVLNQGQLGSCTANAIANAHRFDQMKQGGKPFGPSRLFIYYNERAMEGTVNADAGAMIRDGIKSIAQQGVCDEAEWPYNIAKFARKPSAACFKDALQHQALSYQRVTQSLNQMRGCLASGYPFVFGFTVYEGFESDKVARTGQLDLPVQGEKVIGGHAVLAVGYDDKTQRVKVMNSWGTAWGKKGFFTMPYAYITDDNLADDFWTVRIVEA